MYRVYPLLEIDAGVAERTSVPAGTVPLAAVAQRAARIGCIGGWVVLVDGSQVRALLVHHRRALMRDGGRQRVVLIAQHSGRILDRLVAGQIAGPSLAESHTERAPHEQLQENPLISYPSEIGYPTVLQF